MLREEREEEGEGVRVGVAVAKDVGGEKREYLEREEEARGEIQRIGDLEFLEDDGVRART